MKRENKPFIITSKTYKLLNEKLSLEEIKAEVLYSGLNKIVVMDNISGPVLMEINCE